VPVDALEPAIGFDPVQPAVFQVEADRQRLRVRMNGFNAVMAGYVIFKIDDQIIVFFPDPDMNSASRC